MSKLEITNLTDIPSSIKVNSPGKAVVSSDYVLVPDGSAVKDGNGNTTDNDLTSVINQLKNIGIDYEVNTKEQFEGLKVGRKGVIYLVGDENDKSINAFTEYIWNGNKFELLGDATINLNQYQKIDDDYNEWKQTLVDKDSLNKVVESTEYIPVNYFMYEPYIYKNDGYIDADKKFSISHSSDFIHENCVTLSQENNSFELPLLGNTMQTSLDALNGSSVTISFFARSLSNTKSSTSFLIRGFGSDGSTKWSTARPIGTESNVKDPELSSVWKRFYVIPKESVLSSALGFAKLSVTCPGIVQGERVEIADFQIEPGTILHTYHVSPFDLLYGMEISGVHYKGSTKYIDALKAKVNTYDLITFANGKEQINSALLPEQKEITMPVVDDTLSTTSANAVQNKIVTSQVKFSGVYDDDNKKVTSTVGGITKGTKYSTLKDMSIKDIIKMILFPTIYPTDVTKASISWDTVPDKTIHYGQSLPLQTAFTVNRYAPIWKLDGTGYSVEGVWSEPLFYSVVKDDTDATFNTGKAYNASYQYRVRAQFTPTSGQITTDSNGVKVKDISTEAQQCATSVFEIKTQYPYYLVWSKKLGENTIDLSKENLELSEAGKVVSISRNTGLQTGTCPYIIVPDGTTIDDHIRSVNLTGYADLQRSDVTGSVTVTGWNYEGLGMKVYKFDIDGYQPNQETITVNFTINHD